jgi:hypothetical protein
MNDVAFGAKRPVYGRWHKAEDGEVRMKKKTGKREKMKRKW